MPTSIDFETVDGEPNVWRFEMTLIEYDPKQLDSEKVRFLPTSWQNLSRVYDYGVHGAENKEDLVSLPILDRAIEYFSLQDSLAFEDDHMFNTQIHKQFL